MGRSSIAAVNWVQNAKSPPANGNSSASRNQQSHRQRSKCRKSLQRRYKSLQRVGCALERVVNFKIRLKMGPVDCWRGTAGRHSTKASSLRVYRNTRVLLLGINASTVSRVSNEGTGMIQVSDDWPLLGYSHERHGATRLHWRFRARSGWKSA